MAVAAMQTLAVMAAQYGHGQPVVEPELHNPAPQVPAGHNSTGSWAAGPTGYDAHHGTVTRRGTALAHLNGELAKILAGTVGSTTVGRNAVNEIIADVDMALTALGPVTNTPVGRALVTGVLADAVQRAGAVLGRGQSEASDSSNKIAALAGTFLDKSNAAPSRRHRRRVRRRRHHGALGPSGGPPLTRPSGKKAEWINEALHILRQQGYDVSRMNPADINAIIEHESGGNPHAINGWDSNAAAGHPSKGLMQTIDSTFSAHALPGHRDIWNPVDNIIAGVRYSISRYGSVSNVPGVRQLHEGGGYVGY